MPVLIWLLCERRCDSFISCYPYKGLSSRRWIKLYSQQGQPSRETRTTQSFVTNKIHYLRPSFLNHQSQSLSRSYGSVLPTSLTYIILIDQRLFTLETCCGYGYGLRGSKWYKWLSLNIYWVNNIYIKLPHIIPHAPTFSRTNLSASDSTRAVLLYEFNYPYLWLNQFHGLEFLQRKDNSSRDLNWCQ